MPASLFQGSLLLGGVARAVLGPASVGAPTLIHPAFITGWCGLVVSALNLLPVGSLDGGRMMQVSPLPLIEDRWPHALNLLFVSSEFCVSIKAGQLLHIAEIGIVSLCASSVC